MLIFVVDFGAPGSQSVDRAQSLHLHTMVLTRSAKKQRAPAGSLTGLPDAAMGEVMAFLPRPSQAFFAVAMTHASSSRFWRKIMAEQSGHYSLSAMSTSVVGSSSSWEILNFEEIELALAERISDDDLLATLVCINAGRYLKRITLAGLTNITGSGLLPISGSTVIEMIDLSTVEQHNSAQTDRSINCQKQQLCQSSIASSLQSHVATRIGCGEIGVRTAGRV